MINYAQENNIPLITPEVGQLLTLLTVLKKPKNILEIGFGSGYSSLCMASGFPEARITSLEKDSLRFEKGKEILKHFSYCIDLQFQDARMFLKNAKEKYDFVFIDAVKSQYLLYVQLLEPLMESGAVIIADNIFYRGLVFEPVIFSRKKDNEIKKLKKFCEYITTSEKYQTLIMPLGDGLSFSCFKGQSI